jgi:hypothetical protein
MSVETMDLLRTVGSIAGVLALLWRLVDEFGSWLRLALVISPPSGSWVFAEATVDNKGNRSKDVEYACLLVAPLDEDPIVSAQEIAKGLGRAPTITDTEEIGRRLRIEAPFYGGDRVLLPLPFFYDENERIEDETVKYNAGINKSTLAQGRPYSVRFFIFLEGRLLRCTHAAFVA